jgi:hypothetical protein
MPLPYKPQTVTVRARLQGEEAGIATTGTLAEEVEVRCQVTPETPGAVYERYALEVTNPIRVMCDDADAANFPIQSEIDYDGRTYVVVVEPEIWGAIPATSHASILAKEKR